MQRYGGTLIHSTRDEQGVIEVVDLCGTRSLHFGTPPKQSSLRLDDPLYLDLPYIRAMLASLMFRDNPSRLLILGLGAGTLAKFFLHHFQTCIVDAVELRPHVVEIARKFFRLPNDERLNVHVSDACAFVYQQSERQISNYDLVLVDAYDHIGMEPQINTDTFFKSCHALLAPAGVLAINLWGTHRVSLQKSTQFMKKNFGTKAFKLPVPHRGNVIGFGLREDTPLDVMQGLTGKAMEIEARLGIEARGFLARMKPM